MSHLPKITKECLASSVGIFARDKKVKTEGEKTEMAFDMVERLAKDNPLLQFLIATMAAQSKDPSSTMSCCYAVLNIIDRQLGAEKMKEENGETKTD